MKNTNKRDDLQGLRCVAICGVLAFHLRPDIFKNGWVGVDAFFVLSGYLMATILGREISKASESGASFTSVLANFYIRRFKRIVPLYVLMLAVLTIVVPLVFFTNDIWHFTVDLRWAQFFLSNMQSIINKADYWSQVFSSPVLLHAWSLGVEIQFYLISPFIFLLNHNLSSSSRRMGYLVALSIGSLLVQSLSSPTIAFGAMPCRMWQFLTGALCHELHNSALLDHNPNIPLNKISNIGTAILLFISFAPWKVPETMAKITGTLFTGQLVLTGCWVQNGLLSSRISVYIGDLSYILYLVHWPLIVLTKYHYDLKELDVYLSLKCVLASFAIAIIMHHTLEKYLMTATTGICVIVVTCLYILTISADGSGLINTLSDIAHPTPVSADASFDIAEAIRYNQYWHKLVYFKPQGGERKDIEAERWTNFKEEPNLRSIVYGNGTAKVLLIGNSFAYRAWPALLKVWDGRFAQFRMFSRSVCMVLAEEVCPEYTKAYRRIMEKMKPDITFIIERSRPLLYSPVTTPLEKDEPYLLSQRNIDFISNHSGVVVLDYQFYKSTLPESVAYMIQKRLQRGNMNMDDLKAPVQKYYELHKYERMRTTALKAPSLIHNVVGEQMCDKDWCMFYNPRNMHSYFSDGGCHPTSEGLALMEPAWRRIVDNFLVNNQ